MEEQFEQAAAEQPEQNETVRPDGAGEAAVAEEPAAPPEAGIDGGALTAEELLGPAGEPAEPADAGRAQLKAVLEAIVYVLNEPMPAAQIAQALGRPVQEVEPLLAELAAETSRPDRGIFIREVAGGYQMATKPEHHEVIRNFVRNLKQPLKLSQAALETLAVIAYRQPITRAEIESIRGVNCDGVLRTLIARELVEPVGRLEQPGRPFLYGTTLQFLQYFGLDSLERLPPLPEHAP